jgi:hypothetical protein
MISDYQILDFLVKNHEGFKGKTVFLDVLTIQYWDKYDIHRDFETVLWDCYEHSREGTAYIIVYEKNNKLHIWREGDLESCWIVLVDAKTLYSKRVAPQQALNRPECSICMSKDSMMYAGDDVYIPCPGCNSDELNNITQASFQPES